MSEHPGTVLRVATANAASGRDHRGGQPDIAPWAAAVAALQVDVLAVQEVDHLLPRTGLVDQTAVVAAACAGAGPAWSARFAAAVLGTPGSHDTMRPAPGPGLEAEGAYGVALVSRHPVEEWQELRMAPSRAALPVPLPPDSPERLMMAPDEQRVALAAVLRTPAGLVTVVATHLSFSPLRAGRQLRELVTWAQPLPRPLVLLGDLNLPGPVPPALTGWAPAVRAATFPASGPLLQLDHVLLDAGDSGARILAGEVRPVAHSDHLAVRAELELSPA